VTGDAAAPTPARARCVYGIVPWEARLPSSAQGIGDPAGEVSLLRHEQIAAVTSGMPANRAPLGTRRDLLRFSSLLDAIARSTPVLPMRFGTVLADADAVIGELLAPHHASFARALSTLEGRAQFTVKARYVKDAVLREVLVEEPEIVRLSEALRHRPVEASYYERIRLGELIARAVERRRQADMVALVDELTPYARSVAWRPAATEDGIGDAALLVDRDRWPALERGLEGIARRLAGRMRLRLLGPLAAYDFTDRRIMEEG
jgi:hypothetical protein